MQEELQKDIAVDTDFIEIISELKCVDDQLVNHRQSGDTQPT